MSPRLRAGEQGDIEIVPGKFAPHLKKTPLTYSEALPADRTKSGHWVSAAALIAQDEQEATPQVWLTSQPPEPWSVRYDLIESAADDWQFVVEIDDAGTPHLRFGDGELGAQPPAVMSISATYRQWPNLACTPSAVNPGELNRILGASRAESGPSAIPSNLGAIHAMRAGLTPAFRAA
jgi:hypothetical protein